jgi:hypothetical protein
MPVDASNYFRGIAVKCGHCGYSGLPMGSKLSLSEKLKQKGEDPLEDFQESHLGLESIFSKIALGSFFAFIVSAVSLELRAFTMVAFAGFLIFSLFYGFVRFKNSV